MASEEAKQAPPPGVVPMMITMKPMEAMGLKTGEDIKDTVPWKTFSTEEVKAEIAAKGFYCPFHPMREAIAVRCISTRMLQRACAVSGVVSRCL